MQISRDFIHKFSQHKLFLNKFDIPEFMSYIYLIFISKNHIIFNILLQTK